MAIEKQREKMLSFKQQLEKHTILKYKYGKVSSEDVFNVKELLQRNSSNHMLRNKKAVFKVSKAVAKA